MRLRRSYCTASADPAAVEAAEVGEAEDRDRDARPAARSHGHSGSSWSPITSSTICRAISGTTPARAAEDRGGERDLDVALVLPDLTAQPADPPRCLGRPGWLTSVVRVPLLAYGGPRGPTRV